MLFLKERTWKKIMLIKYAFTQLTWYLANLTPYRSFKVIAAVYKQLLRLFLLMFHVHWEGKGTWTYSIKSIACFVGSVEIWIENVTTLVYYRNSHKRDLTFLSDEGSCLETLVMCYEYFGQYTNFVTFSMSIQWPTNILWP